MNIISRIKSAFSRDSALIWTLIIVGILVYLNCLPNEMFWDDDDFILNNIYIRDWSNWPLLFQKNILSGTHLLSNYWRPLLQIVFAVEWHLWADWAPGWHFVSIVFHAAATAVLFLFLKTLFNSRALAFLTAAMFLLHPAQNEAVVYPNSLGDPLANLLVFAGLLFFTRFRSSGIAAPRSGNWWLALAAYPLALMSKETGILFLPYLILSDWILQPANAPLRRKAAAILKAVWPFILIAIIYMALRATVLNFNNSFNFYKEENVLTAHFSTRFFTFLRVLSIYAGILFVPYDLRVERLIDPSTRFFVPDVLFGALIFTILIGLAWRNMRSRPAVTFGILWFFAGILPTSNLFVIINALVYEHFLYTSLIGIWLIIFWRLLRWARNHQARQLTVAAICIVLFTTFAVRNIWRNTDWRTAITFYEKLAPTAPTSYRVLNNLGMEYAEKGILDKAEATYRKAMALDTTNAVAYHNLANIYRDRSKQGDTAAREEAIALYEKTLSLQDNFIFSYKSLAQLYLDKGDYPNARRILEKHFSMTDEKLFAIDMLTKIAIMEKNWPMVRHYLEVTLQLKPGDVETTKTLQKINDLLGRTR